MTPNFLPSHATVTIETPRWSFTKRSASGIDFRSPVPTPFNYGSILDTLAPDGEPVDAIVLGPRLSQGSRWHMPVLGIVKFVDDSLPDDKWILGLEISRSDCLVIDAFFAVYAQAKSARHRYSGKSGAKYLGFAIR